MSIARIPWGQEIVLMLNKLEPLCHKSDCKMNAFITIINHKK